MKVNHNLRLIDELTYYKKRLKMLITSDKGKVKYEDEADEVFTSLFCVENFVSDYLDAKNAKKANRLLDKIDRESFRKIIGTNSYYKVVASLIAILIELDKKKTNKKTRKHLEKMYKKTMRALIDKVDIQKPTNGIDLRFLESFNKSIEYDDDDDDYGFDSEIDFWDDDDDDDDYGITAFGDFDEMDNMSEYFSSSKKKRRYRDDDDEESFESSKLRKLSKTVEKHGNAIDEVLAKLDKVIIGINRSQTPQVIPVAPPAAPIQIPKSAPSRNNDGYESIVHALDKIVKDNNSRSERVNEVLLSFDKRLKGLEDIISEAMTDDDDEDDGYYESDDEMDEEEEAEDEVTQNIMMPQQDPSPKSRGNLTRMSEANWVPKNEILSKMAEASTK